MSQSDCIEITLKQWSAYLTTKKLSLLLMTANCGSKVLTLSLWAELEVTDKNFNRSSGFDVASTSAYENSLDDY